MVLIGCISMFGISVTFGHPVTDSPIVHLRINGHHRSPGDRFGVSGDRFKTKRSPTKPLITRMRVTDGDRFPKIYDFTRAHKRSFWKNPPNGHHRSPGSGRPLMRVTAQLATCQTCRGPILAALCDGIETRCEPVPLSRRGELLAALTGVATYRLDSDRRLHANDQWRILADCPMPGDHRLAAHRCDCPIPTDWIDIEETA